MIQRLGNNIEIRIPFKTIFKSQRYMLRRLYESLSTGHNYIGECKMSQRMTYITLALLFALVDEPSKNKIYYVAETKHRALEVKQMAIKLRQFYKKNQFPQPTYQRTSMESLDKQFKLQKSEIVVLQNFFHKQINLLKDYPNDKYISIMSIKEYFTEIVQQKVHHRGSHAIKSDYLLIETVAYDEIVQSCVSGWTNEIVIRRAFIEHRKLEFYYHQRDDKKRLAQKNPNLNKNTSEGPRIHQSLKKRHSSSSIDKDNHSNMSQGKQSNKGSSIFHHHHKNQHQRQWNISEIQKRIQEVYLAKKQILLKKGQKKNDTEMEQEKVDPMKKLTFEQQALIALQTVGYLINYFQNLQVETRKSNKTGKDEVSTDQISSESIIEEMEKKMLVKRDKLKRLYAVFKKLTETYPPIVHPQIYLESNIFFRKGRSSVEPYQLSTKHILQLTRFVKDLIEFNEVFNQKYSECIQVTKSCFKERDRPSFFQVRFKCLNQPLLTEMILQFNQNFVVLMNNGISLEFYSSYFKPKILMSETNPSIIEQEKEENDKSFKFCFDAPTTVADHVFNNVYGLNVTITPSQDNLKIPELTSKQDAQHDSLIVKAYGVLLYDLCEVISDGIVVYFPNTSVIEKFKHQWTKNQDIFKKINQMKRVFEETQLEEDNNNNIEEYKKVCDIGRGGIFFIAANGGMAKYTQFYGHYSRCIVFVGIPKSHERKKDSQADRQERKKKDNHSNLKEAELETFYGLKTTAKCLSNTINCNLEPKSVIFADVSYNKQSSKKWFPFIQQGSLNTTEVVEKVKRFHQHMEKRYEEGIQWQAGKSVRKRSFSKSK